MFDQLFSNLSIFGKNIADLTIRRFNDMLVVDSQAISSKARAFYVFVLREFQFYLQSIYGGSRKETEDTGKTKEGGKKTVESREEGEKRES